MKTLAQDIKSGNFKNAYLICGEEEYLKLNYKNQLIKAIAGEDTMNLALYEGKNIDINEVIDNAETFPFFAKYRLIVLEQSGLFKTGGEQLAEYMDKIPETTIFLFVEQDVDKRSKMYKAVKKNGYICEINRQSEKDIEVWAAKIFDYNGKKITKADMAYFIANVGTDMEILSQEIEKLISYAYDKNVINKNDIDAVCITQVTNKIFDMIAAIANRQTRKAMDLYEDLLTLKEPSMRILFLIARQFNQILQVKELMGRGMDKSTISSKLKIQPFVTGKIMVQAKTFTKEQILSYVNLCVDAEESVKTGKLSDRLAVELLIANKY